MNVPYHVQAAWSNVKVKLFVLILSAVYSIFYDPLISIDIKKVQLWIKIKLSTETHRNAASQNISAYKSILPSK